MGGWGGGGPLCFSTADSFNLQKNSLNPAKSQSPGREHAQCPAPVSLLFFTILTRNKQKVLLSEVCLSHLWESGAVADIKGTQLCVLGVCLDTFQGVGRERPAWPAGRVEAKGRREQARLLCGWTELLLSEPLQLLSVGIVLNNSLEITFSRKASKWALMHLCLLH